MDLRSQLIEVADHYATAQHLSVSRVSTLLFNDGKRLSRIAAGADLTTRSLEGALQWFSDHWPAGSTWPGAVHRPPPTPGPSPTPPPEARP